ncbi:MAG: hypothetical protein PHY31_03630 [Smithellaceae bacterium]|nr:hypothetical protein [Smithellaceae bacterium]
MKKRIWALITIMSFLMVSCVILEPGHHHKGAPGQIQKDTGYNPASGKHKK